MVAQININSYYIVAEGVSAMTGINAHSASFFNGVNRASVLKAIAHGLSRTAISELRYGTTKGAFLSRAYQF